MSSDNQALISSQHGYLMFDFKLGTTPREVKELSLPDGKSLTTGINTVYRDKEGAIWLGTYTRWSDLLFRLCWGSTYHRQALVAVGMGDR